MQQNKWTMRRAAIATCLGFGWLLFSATACVWPGKKTPPAVTPNAPAVTSDANQPEPPKMQQVEPEIVAPQPSLTPEILAQIEAIDMAELANDSPAMIKQRLGQIGVPFTPDIFIECSMFGWPKLMKIMLMAGMDVNVQRADGGNALTAACLHGDPALVQTLIDYGADLKASFNEYEQPAMHFAVLSQKLEMVQFLLDHGVAIDERDNLGRTGLMVAVENSTPEMVRFLVDKQADINAEDQDQRTPLQRSVRGGSLENVKLLVSKGADVRHRDSAMGATALYDAAAFGRWEIFSYLLEQGADYDITDKNGINTIHVAAASGSLPIVTKLLELGADADCVVPNSGATPLFAALDAMQANPEVVKLLLDHGAKVNMSCNGATPLLLAVRNGQVDIVKMLLDRGADPKVVTPEGFTLLHIATMSNVAELVQTALDLGVDPLAETHDGWTALRIAEENHCDEATPLLRQAMGLPPAEEPQAPAPSTP